MTVNEHRGLIPAASVLPGLVKFYISKVASLGSTPVPSAYGPVLSGHTFLEGQVERMPSSRFQPTEPRSISLPRWLEGALQFGTASMETDWQALTGLSWLSYSRSWICQEPRKGQIPVRVVTNPELPTPARLNEPSWRPESPGRDFHPLGTSRPGEVLTPQACLRRPG